MEASDSLSRTLGMDFFIPFPFPNFGNGIFSFPSHSRNLGMDFFIFFPFLNFGNVLFQFLSRSRTLKKHSRSPLHWAQYCLFFFDFFGIGNSGKAINTYDLIRYWRLEAFDRVDPVLNHLRLGNKMEETLLQ